MKRNELLATAQEYARKAEQWFAAGQDSLRAKEIEILTQARWNVPGLREAVTRLTEVVRSLRQDQDLVAKHLSEMLAAPTDPAPAQATAPRRSSVLAALGAMERSIQGWLQLKEFFPEREDDVLDMLVYLDRLRRAVELEFPEDR